MLPVLSDLQFAGINGDSAPAGPFDLESRLVSGDYAKVAIDKEVAPAGQSILDRQRRLQRRIAKLAPRLPVVCDTDNVTLGGKTYPGEHLGFFASFPHPDGQRYVACSAATSRTPSPGGCRVGLQLLPDYLVFDHDRAIDWGFWDNHWQHAGADRPAAN